MTALVTIHRSKQSISLLACCHLAKVISTETGGHRKSIPQLEANYAPCRDSFPKRRSTAVFGSNLYIQKYSAAIHPNPFLGTNDGLSQ
jgi:hypothetical protein